ncbi:DtxR family transcriptional regulator, Mn-dependent transcriptional regulator [Ruminococcus sp. YE71]|uniref:metal-dependent transcriptional regulator n=1 Tax=unclassified Ruminococcus TaxID=2608920 RepID=UPI00088AFF8F|nr:MULTISPECIES: metal-dependent transcriptional regulator [unclassified Ruminococcus]SDA23636.1 DtxR family transcriptional regulator, Mn-dependent transcriptional regulator [Ruminococcus sp. YE78]SFW40192.1 DtxR family transcriptional regulator, Mn-dependent transcriptional regulator [Ruminococcus sp. YE71]
MLTEQQKKYLITIYQLGQNGKTVRTTDIAEYLHVAKASVVKMEKKLIEEGLISKEPYRRIALTQKGVSEANGLFTPCVILQDFLSKKVCIAPEKAGEASMMISSVLDEQTLEKLVGYLLSQSQ